MPRACAVVIELTAAERRVLKQRDRGGMTPWQDRVRARIVRRAAQGQSNERIARELGITVDTVRCWRGRFAAGRLDGLDDLPRSGRPARITPVQVAQVRALACQLPAETGVPLSRWSCPELAAELIRRQMLPAISASTVRRILAEDPIKPWQHQSWISIRDPGFVPKASRVLELYQRRWDGEPLGEDEYVISSDAKPSIQARCRCHPTLAPGVARMMRVEHEYQRKGALAYIAALDVHRAKVFGHCAPTTGIVPFMTLVGQVMSQEPYASAKRVFWVVDNGSDHRGQAAASRLAKACPNAVLVHTPVHASWLNQVECFFSIVQRKVLTPGDFTDLSQVQHRLLAFQDRYNATATPFRWKFTAADLAEVIARIDRHEPTPPPPVPKKARTARKKTTRRHSSPGMISPVAFEAGRHKAAAAPLPRHRQAATTEAASPPLTSRSAAHATGQEARTGQACPSRAPALREVSMPRQSGTARSRSPHRKSLPREFRYHPAGRLVNPRRSSG